MLEKIQEKLANKLKESINEESQVVYILSRVRKILEIDQHKNQGKYKKLKFYCDWALHAEIEKGTKAFQEEFEKFVQGDMDAGGAVLTFQFFDTEFISFLEQYKISKEKYVDPKNNVSFKKMLAQIYKDTPLIVTLTKKFKITTNAGIFKTLEKETKYEIGFQITPMD